jgi:hypothetical protein
LASSAWAGEVAGATVADQPRTRRTGSLERMVKGLAGARADRSAIGPPSSSQ